MQKSCLGSFFLLIMEWSAYKKRGAYMEELWIRSKLLGQGMGIFIMLLICGGLVFFIVKSDDFYDKMNKR